DPSDTFAVNHAWGTGDDGGGPEKQGHGTQMGGLAAYGDLGEALASSGRITVYNQLESVKILPPRGKNEPELYGAVTAQAVSLPEINKPHRKRVFSLAVSSDDRGGGLGQPSSWSAAIDALAAGRLI